MGLTRKQQADLDMLRDAMTVVETSHLLEAIRSHIEARPDIDGQKLEQFSDALRRTAWSRQREGMKR